MSVPRVLYFGMEGAFSWAPLVALLDAAVEVAAVVVPRPRAMTPASAPIRLLDPPARPPRSLPLGAAPAPRTIIGLAWQSGIPLLEVARLTHEETLVALRDLRPDIICVACFPRLLPREVRDLSRYGALNVHPSLLPAYRGPDPLFWVFHDGLEHAGVTVHFLDEGADTGDIVAQAPLVLPDGVSYREAEQRCAQEGGRLLAQAVCRAGWESLARQPQPRGSFPIAPMPKDEDFVVTPQWPARCAFNFMRGLAAGERPVLLQVGQERIGVREAIACEATATQGELIERAGQYLRVRCSPGVLTIRPDEQAATSRPQ